MGWDRCPRCYKPFHEGLCDCKNINQPGQPSPVNKKEEKK